MVAQGFRDFHLAAIQQVDELKRVYDTFPLEMIVRDDECRSRVL
jgi:hypothetical protein